MPRWAWWLPFGGLVACAALLGWKQGWIAANVSESDAISLYAARYAREIPGAAPTDCRAYPAQGPRAWMVVVCGPEPHDPTRHVTYHIDRGARLLNRVGPESS